MYRLDGAERFVTVNGRLVELTGYARDALLGERVSLVFDETDRQRVERELSELGEGATFSMTLPAARDR